MSLTPYLWPALALAGAGAILDIKDRRLPNWLCGALALLAVLGLALSGDQSQIPSALLHAATALIVGMGLFSVGAIGGGDAKFYAAGACALPLASAVPFLGWTSLAGLLLLVGMMIFRLIVGRSAKALSLKGWSVPYGVAIAAGLAVTLLN